MCLSTTVGFCLDEITCHYSIGSFIQEYLLVEDDDSVWQQPSGSILHAGRFNVGSCTVYTDLHISNAVLHGDFLVELCPASRDGNNRISICICRHGKVAEVKDSAAVIISRII